MADVSQSGFLPNGNTMVDNSNNNNDKSPYGYNGFLIALEVVFSVIVILVLLSCFYAGLRKKKRLNYEKQKAIESAISQQEYKFLAHLEGRCHSSSTITTVHQTQPPSYTPPDPKYVLPKEAVTRLDCLLSHNQICTKSLVNQPTPCMMLPRYTDSAARATSKVVSHHLYY